MQQGKTKCECLAHKHSLLDRPVTFLPVVVLMLAGLGCVVVFGDVHGLVELFSVITYSATVTLWMFSAGKGQQPYFFDCPIVRRLIPRLIWRHGCFLIALFALEASSFFLVRYLPASWITVHGRNGSPFDKALFVLCLFLAFGEVLSGRILLEREHIEDSSQPSITSPCKTNQTPPLATQDTDLSPSTLNTDSTRFEEF